MQAQLCKRNIIGIDPGTVNFGVCMLGVLYEPTLDWKTSRVRVEYLSTHNIVKNKKQSMCKSLVQLLNSLYVYHVDEDVPITYIAVERQFRGKMRNVFTAVETWALTHEYKSGVFRFAAYNASDIKRSFGIRCSGHSSNKRNALLAARALTVTQTVKNQTHPIEDDHQADALLIALHHLHKEFKYPLFEMGKVFLAYENILKTPPSTVAADTSATDSEGESCSHSYHDSRCSRNESAECHVHPKLRHKTEPVLPPAPEAPVPAGPLP